MPKWNVVDIYKSGCFPDINTVLCWGGGVPLISFCTAKGEQEVELNEVKY